MSDNAKPSTRKGKVARLPYDIREQINALIRDGAPASRLNTFLVQNGHEAMTDMNWTNWRHGGYQDWLKEQTRLDAIRDKHESMRREFNAKGLDFVNNAMVDAAVLLGQSDLPPDRIATAMAAIKNSFSGSERTKIAERRAALAEQALNLEREKFAAAQARAAQADKAEGVVQDATLTPEEKQIRIREIFGLA
jgi:hypothetical protein